MMKKIHLLLIAFLVSISAMAQTTISVPKTGTIALTDPAGLTTYVSTSAATYKVSTNRVQIIGPTGVVVNDIFSSYKTGGVAYASLADLVQYLQDNNVAVTAAGGGGGGGGSYNPYPGSDYAKNAPNVSIDGKTPSLGQATMAASSPVAIASNQSAIPISAATLPLPTGAATATAQTTGNTSLTSIDIKTPALVSGSVPVTVTSTTRTLVNKAISSVTVATTSTSVSAANAAGYRVIISVPSTATASVWLFWGGTATATAASLELTPGSSYQTSDNFPEVQAITAISTVSQPVNLILY